MKLHQLRYLVAVAEEGSLLRAARRIGVAQPALSQQLKSLEEGIGTVLLRRTSQGTNLTRSGEIMVAHARTILEQVSAAQRDVSEQTNIVSGEVSLALSNAVAEAVVPELLRRLSSDYPLITLRIQASDSVTARIGLENARTDLGVIPDYSTLKGLNAKPFWTDDLWLVSAGAATTGHSEPDAPITFREAIRHPLVLIEKSNPLRQNFERMAFEIGARLTIFAETNSLLMMRSYVESGLSHAILPLVAVAEKVRLGKVHARRIIDPVITQSYLVCWPKTRPLSRAGQIVMEMLSDIAALDTADDALHGPRVTPN